MRHKKVTRFKHLFENEYKAIKAILEVKTAKEVVKLMGRSITTVVYIQQSTGFSDYKRIIKESLIKKPKVSQSVKKHDSIESDQAFYGLVLDKMDVIINLLQESRNEKSAAKQARPSTNGLSTEATTSGGYPYPSPARA